MSNLQKEIAERLKKARENAGYESQTDFCKKFGLEVGTYNHHEKGARGIKNPILEKYSRYLNVSIDWLISGIDRQTTPNLTPEWQERIQEMTPESQKQLPVYGYVSGSGDYQATVHDANIIDHQKAHVLHEAKKNPFWLVVIGDSMFPRYKQGEKLAVQDAGLPKNDVECVIILNNGDAHVKIYKTMTDKEIILSQYNPEKEIKYNKSDIDRILEIVGTSI